jgi:hypothetical protein
MVESPVPPYWDARVDEATTLPRELVVRSAFVREEMANLVVVALVVVPFVTDRFVMVEEEKAMRPLVNVSVEVVAKLGNGSCPDWRSVPQERTPLVDALTSQEALLRDETVRRVVEAVPVTARLVVVAFVPVALSKVKFLSVVEPERRRF